MSWDCIQGERRRPDIAPTRALSAKQPQNSLRRHFDGDALDTVWSTDITEFKRGEGKVYLSLIKDFCTGEIISYRYSASPNLDMVMNMMRDAIAAHPCASGLMVQATKADTNSLSCY